MLVLQYLAVLAPVFVVSMMWQDHAALRADYGDHQIGANDDEHPQPSNVLKL